MSTLFYIYYKFILQLQLQICIMYVEASFPIHAKSDSDKSLSVTDKGFRRESLFSLHIDENIQFFIASNDAAKELIYMTICHGMVGGDSQSLILVTFTQDA